MDINGTLKPVAVQPAPRVQQPSIRSFFQPRTPTYTASPDTKSSQVLPTMPQTASSISPPLLSRQSQIVAPSPNANHGNGISNLPPQATISLISHEHIQPLRRINSLLLPINYPDSFYHAIFTPTLPTGFTATTPTPSFSRVILWTDPTTSETKVVGGIISRLEPSIAPDSTQQVPKFLEGIYDIYVQSLVLLSPYRSLGLAAAALQSVIEAATDQQGIRIGGLYAHVWTENMEALEWYAARGFKRKGGLIHGYYRKLKPDTAWILRRSLGINDHLAYASPLQTTSESSVVLPVSRPAPPMSTASPTPVQAQTRPLGPPHAASFQDRRPDREWNDLPEDVLGASLLKPSSANASLSSSRSSSRSGLGGKKKKDRSYPAAAFGS